MKVFYDFTPEEASSETIHRPLISVMVEYEGK